MSVGKAKRFRVLRRCNFRCHYCGRPASEVPLEIDHVVLRSLDGSDDESNLVAACVDCNRGKAADAAVEMKAELVWLPDGGCTFLYPDAAIRAAMRELGLI